MEMEGKAPIASMADEFNRLPAARKIIELLSSKVKISPLVIDGDWGAGKTVFCNKIIDLVREDTQRKFEPVYIDAFKADHADQPLMTLLAAILDKQPLEQKKSLMKKALPVLKFGLKVSGKAGVGWLLRTSADELGKDLEDAARQISGAVIDKAVEAMLVEHMEAGKSLATLRDVLKEISDEMPNVVFVDELDRCRPDFAVRMLEVIKHVFDVVGVQFVLVANTRQLIASIKHCYGNEISAQRYLDKFIGFSFRLPSQCKDHDDVRCLAAQLHFEHVVKSSPVLSGENILTDKSLALEVVNELIEFRRLSLREVETFVRYFEILFVASDGRDLKSPMPKALCVLAVYSVYCYCFCPALASDIANGIFDVVAVGDSVGAKERSVFIDGGALNVRNGLIGLLLFDQESAWRYFELNLESIITDYEEEIVRVYEANEMMQRTGKRLEIVRNFLRTFHLGCDE